MIDNIKNPATEEYEIKILAPELTFLGVKNQPDFAELEITMIPSDIVVELKSFKHYLYEFRNKLTSYEKLINDIYDDLMETFDPVKLVVTMKCRPRGGISSILKINSEWRK